MTTTAASNVRFGGSGFGPEYITARRKRQVDPREHKSHSTGSGNLGRQGTDDETEVFLFTVKDPVRSALVKLMALIKFSIHENPVIKDEIPEIVAGPLGYTSIRAVRPQAYVPTKTVFKPVLR